MDRRMFLSGMGTGGLLLVTTTACRAAIGSGGTYQDVTAHGAKGDAKMLNDAAFQAAVDALPSTGGEIYIPPGIYLRADTTRTGGKPVVFRGAGKSICSIEVVHQSNDLFVHSGVESAEFRDFTIYSSVQRTGGAYIRLDPGAGKINYSSAVERVRMYGYYVGVDLVRCSDARIRDCPFNGKAGTYAALLIRNLTNADSGDNSVTGCFFGGPGGAGIRQESSGGLRLIDNKFNGLVDSFILSPNGEISTSILLIQGNSFENATRQNILLDQGNGKTVFTYGVITGNQFGYAPTAISVKGGGKSFFGFVIDHNIFAVPNNGVGILLDGGNMFQVKDNLFDGVGTGGKSIVVTKAEVNPDVGANRLRNVP